MTKSSTEYKCIKLILNKELPSKIIIILILKKIYKYPEAKLKSQIPITLHYNANKFKLISSTSQHKFFPLISLITTKRKLISLEL